MSVLTFLRSFFVTFCCVSLVLTQYPLAAHANLDAEQSQNVDAIYVALDEMDGSIDRAAFDVSALARSLAFDPRRMFAFVQSEIRYQPYVGVLRGARGTLAARTGNAFDQSYLLASLLREAGYQVRFITGTLPDDKVEAVLAQFAATPMSPPSEPWSEAEWATTVASLEATVPAFTDFLDFREEQLDQASLDFWDRVDWHDSLLQSVSPVDETGARLDLATEAQDHVWVRYLDESGSWIDLDPTVPETGFGETAASEEQEHESLPEDVHHRLGIIATIYVSDPAGTVTEHKVLEETLTIAETTGERVSYRNLPDVDDRPEPATLAAWLGGIDSFTAVLRVGQEARLGMGFNLSGEVYEPSADPVAAVREATEEGFGGLGSGLDSLFAPQDDTQPQGSNRLIGQSLTYTLTIPRADGETETVQYDRTLASPYEVEQWDATAPTLAIADHETVTLVADLLQRFEMTPISGQLSLAQFAAFEFQALRDNRALIESLTSAVTGQDSNNIGDAGAQGAGSLPTLGLVAEWQILLAQHVAQRHPNAVLYRAEPALVGYVTGFGVAGDDVALRQSYDILHSRSRAVDRDDGTSLPALQRFAGVVETVLEEDMLRPLFDVPLAQPVGTPAVFEAASNQAIDILVIGPDEPRDDLHALTLSEEIKADIAADLDRGYAVVLPSTASALDGQTIVGWWRTDIQSGETLGILPGGGGSAGTEDLFTRIMNNIFSKEGMMTFVDIMIGLMAGAACVAGSSVVEPDHSTTAQTVDLFACIAVAVLVGYGINAPASHARRLAVAGVVVAFVVAATS